MFLFKQVQTKIADRQADGRGFLHSALAHFWESSLVLQAVEARNVEVRMPPCMVHACLEIVLPFQW